MGASLAQHSTHAPKVWLRPRGRSHTKQSVGKTNDSSGSARRRLALASRTAWKARTKGPGGEAGTKSSGQVRLV
jgi:hypothetical protein